MKQELSIHSWCAAVVILICVGVFCLCPAGAYAAPLAAGTYTVSANIWVDRSDSGLPLNVHLTSNAFPPMDPSQSNAIAYVDEENHTWVRLPITIQPNIMTLRSIEGLDLVGEEAAGATGADDARWAALDRLANLMRQISCALGSASPFCDDVESLCAEADKLMGRFRGANGRYRAAKACMPPASVQGVLATSSLYENTDIILKLFSDSWELPVPILHVNFDAALDQGIEERIRSFLYYLQPTVPATSEQPANESLVSEVSCG